MKINDKTILGIKPQKNKYYICDKGLIITVYPTGTITFSMRQMIDGKRRMRRLGKYPHISVKDARKLYDQFYIIREEQIEITEKIEDLTQLYLEQKKDKLKGKTFNCTKSICNKHIIPNIGKYLTNKVTTNMLYRIFKDLGVKSALLRAIINTTREIFDLAIVLGQIDKNPVIEGFSRLFVIADTVNRKSLEIDNIRYIQYFYDFMDKEYADCLTFTVLSMLRINEVLSLELSDVNFETKTISIPKERMKMKRDFVLPLTEHMEKLINRNNKKYCFEFKGKLIPYTTLYDKFKKSEVGKDFDIHGFRATARTWLATAGVQFEVAEMCLAHQEKSAVVRAYNRADYLEQRRDVMKKWNDYVIGETKKGS